MTIVDTQLWSTSIFTGGWRPGSGGTASVVNPATGAVLGQVALAGVPDVDAAALRAAAAQPEWAEMGYPQRSSVFRRAAARLEQEQDEVVGWLVREGGGTVPKPSSKSR